MLLLIDTQVLLKITDAVQALKDQMNNLQINPSGERFPKAISAIVQSENPKISINTYDKAMRLNLMDLTSNLLLGTFKLQWSDWQSSNTNYFFQHRAETHRKSEGHSKNRRYAKFSMAFWKIEIPIRKSSKSHCTGSTKRHMYPLMKI